MPETRIDSVVFQVPQGYRATPISAPSPAMAKTRGAGEVRAVGPVDVFFSPDREVQLVATATMEPAEGVSMRGMRRSFGIGEFAAEVEVAPDERAVVLVEQDGVFRWVYANGDDPSLSARRRSRGKVLRFEIDATPPQGPATAPGRRSLASGAWDYLKTKLQVYVFRWVADSVAQALAERLDRNIVSGLVPMKGAEPQAWKTDRDFRFEQVEGKAFRILLFVHGTFSSTAGSFGGLRNPPLNGVCEGLFSAYDAVVGFEHKTLVETPLENAEQLIAALQKAAPPEGAIVDIVAFSRGGLVTRVFLEKLAEARQEALPGLHVREVAFVGCTNSGTYLAEPENIRDLLNLYTTMFAWGANLVSTAFPPSAATVQVIKGLLCGIGDFVKALAEAAIEEEAVPGLAAMRPQGPLVAELNGAEEDDGAPPRYRALAIDFEPPPIYEAGPRLVALDAVADGLFRNADNDLVVHTDSMAAFGARQARLVDQIRKRSDRIYHTRYFDEPLTADTLLFWLAPGLAEMATFNADAISREAFSVMEARLAERRGLENLEAAFRSSGGEPTPADFELGGPGGGGGPGGPRAGSGGGGGGGPGGSGPGRAAGGAVPVASTAGQVQVEAAMPKAPPVATPFGIKVTFSRGAITATAGEVAITQAISVRPDDSMVVTVAAVENGELLSPARITGVTPPLEHEQRTFTFMAQCPHPGQTRFVVEVWRAASRLFGEELVAEAGAPSPGAETSKASAISQDGDGYDGILILTVFDRRAAGGDTLLSFTLTGMGLNVEGASPLDARTYDDFIDEALSDLEMVFRSATTTASLEEMVRALGIQLADAVLPAEIRSAIWRVRDRIKGILVMADEHQLPWEAFYLDDPKDDAQAGFFLAEKGLTRWFRKIGLPKRRHGRSLLPAAYVKPDYVDPSSRLPGLDREIRSLDAAVGPLSRWNATSRQMVAELRGRQALGVLHLCGHGNTARSTLREGLLMLQDTQDPQTQRFVNDVLDSRLVSANVRFNADSAPVVFLNVCRAGRATRGLVGAAGYARAFVAPRSEAGAGVFVAAQWEVNDDGAAAFAEAFYQALAGGTCLAEASSRAKTTARAKAADLTWLAYCVYGDPATTFKPVP